MSRITEECVARIKSAANIVDVVGRYVPLRRSGYSWKACCPFHTEKTPSFYVTPSRQSFHCFGCGVGGDAVKFVMMFENLDYPTALRRLADIAGIPVIEEEENPEVARRRRLRSEVIRLNELVAQFYHNQLCRNTEAQHVREYLQQRGINIRIAKNWQLGWAPPSLVPLRQFAASHNFDERILTAAYLVSTGDYGTRLIFRDRLMFPIRNVRGEVVGFSGRVMQTEQDPRKYVNTAETVAFRKGELLFGLNKATAAIGKAGMQVVICEGQLDVIACHEYAEVRNAVAGLGTAFTDDHAATLAKYAKRAVLCYDGDRAGMSAAEKTYRKLAAVGLEVYQAALPPGEDPDSFIRTRGADAMRQTLADARPYLLSRLSRELELCGTDAGQRAALVPRMAELTAQVKDPIRRDAAVVDLATRLNIGPESFRTVVGKIQAQMREDARKEAGRGTQRREDTSADDDTPVVPLQMHNVIAVLISMAISNQRAQDMLVDRIEELQEPIRVLPGGILLQRVLEALPEAGNAEAFRQFLAGLPPEQALALQGVRAEAYPEERLGEYVNDACARAADFALRERIDSLRSAIRECADDPVKLAASLRELQRLQRIYASLV